MDWGVTFLLDLPTTALLPSNIRSLAFWDGVYTEVTHAVSDPTTRSSPIAVDFFRIGRRGEKYGPLGELIPAQTPVGSGYFECALNASSIPDFLENVLGLGNSTS